MNEVLAFLTMWLTDLLALGTALAFIFLHRPALRA